MINQIQAVGGILQNSTTDQIALNKVASVSNVDKISFENALQSAMNKVSQDSSSIASITNGLVDKIQAKLLVDPIDMINLHRAATSYFVDVSVLSKGVGLCAKSVNDLIHTQ